MIVFALALGLSLSGAPEERPASSSRPASSQPASRPASSQSQPASQPSSRPALQPVSQPSSRAASRPSTQPRAPEPVLEALPSDAFVPTPPALPDALEPTTTLKDYALYYGPEWILDGVLITTSALLYDVVPAGPALIGIRVDEENDARLLDPKLDSLIGRPYIRQQVSELSLGLGLAGAGIAVAIGDGLWHQDFHHTHNFLLGMTTTLASTMATTHVSKLVFGRLRPDFRDRYVRAACAGNIRSSADFDCETVDDGFEVSAQDVERGRRSFVSGHSSLSFAFATYLGMHLGSSYIWGDAVPTGTFKTFSQVAGVLGTGFLLGSATYVATSRLTDGRHHAEDVFVGSALGASLGMASYLLHFDLKGNAHRRGWRVQPMIGETNGAQVSGTF